MKKKNLYLSSALLIVLFPFLNFSYQVFRGVSVSFVHSFERHASFNFQMRPLFQKYIHFHLTDFWIVGLMLGAFLLKEVRFKDLFFNRHSRFLTLYSGVAFLSILFSSFSNYFYQYTTLINLIIAFLSFPLIYLLFSKRTDLMIPILYAFVGIATLECLIGVGQFLAQQSLGLRFLAEPQITPYMENIAIYPLTEGNRALFDKLPWIPEGQTNSLRSLGTFDHPNIFGAYLSIALFLSYMLFITTTKKGCRIALLFLIPLHIMTLGLTFSRSAIFASMVGTLAFFTLGFVKRKMFSEKERKSFYLLTLLISAGFFLALFVLFEQLIARGGFIHYNELASASDSERLLHYRLALMLFISHPLLGIGFNSYALFPYETIHPSLEGANPTGMFPHNIYLQIASETGAIGLILFFLFIASILLLMRKRELTPLRLTLGSIFFIFLMLGLVDHFLWVYNSGRLMFFLFSGLFAASLKNRKSQQAFSLA
ncbi:MAG: O-antigen ligase family protein [Simkaniaceae bacterium]|nr:O-antigen ligase family protein [Simkaniaceae bacterium]